MKDESDAPKMPGLTEPPVSKTTPFRRRKEKKRKPEDNFTTDDAASALMEK